jgi:hypothetical protein
VGIPRDVDEFGPGRLRGHGAVEPEAAARVEAMQERLRRVVDGLAAVLQQPQGPTDATRA